jgi:hypothetical protein
MKRNPRLIFGSVVVAALMATGAGWAQTDSGKTGTTGSGTGQTIHPSPKGSEGGSRSERSGESSVPLPKGSPQSGTVDMGKSGGSTGSGSSGMSSSGSSGMSGSSGTAMGNRGSGSNIKEVQQALKDKGYDPGPIDGRMGAKTKEALKSFQSASNLSATGTLNSETAEKLGVQSSSSSAGSSSMGTGKSSSSGSGSMRSNDTRSNSNTTKGKDTDQPNK